MIELIRKARGDVFARIDGRIVSANSPRTLIEKLIRLGVEDASVRVVDGDSYVQFLSLAAARAGLSARPSPEYSPRPVGQSFGNAEIWDTAQRRWVRPARPE